MSIYVNSLKHEYVGLFLQVEFSPTLRKLAQVVNVMPQLISLISEFKRLQELLSNQESQKDPIHIIIGQNIFFKT